MSARRTPAVVAPMALLAALALAPAADAASPASISTSFGVSSVPLNGSTNMNFAIGNPNFGTGLTSIGFDDALPPGLVVANPNGVSDDCNGTLTAAAGSSDVTLSGATLGPGTLCLISVNVVGTWGGDRNNSVAVGSSAGTGNTATATLTVGMPPVAPRVYWTNSAGGLAGFISFANLDGSGGGDLSTPGVSAVQPEGVALDPAAGRIYWANSNGEAISYANLDGSGGGDLNTMGATVSHPTGLAIDPVARRIWWGNGNNTIAFANLDGTGGRDLSAAGATISNPNGVAVDPAAGRIYWANESAPVGIFYAALDGSGGGQLVTSGATLSGPRGVAVDPGAGRIYWANFAATAISYANLGDSGGGDLNTSGATVQQPAGVAVDPLAGRIYWANGVAGPISFAKLDGSGGGGDLATPYPLDNEYPALLEGPAGAGIPAISGAATTGSPLTCSEGSWSAGLTSGFLFRAPEAFAYQWTLGGADIPGATSSSYTPTAPGDFGCRVTASNFIAGASQTSAPRTVVNPPPAGTPPAAGTPPGQQGAAGTKPTLSALRESRSIFAVGRAATPRTGVAAARRHGKGTVFSFRLDQPAAVTIAIQRLAAGRRSHGRCVAERPKLRRDRRCTRRVHVATLTRTGHAGLDKVGFSGRIVTRPLPPGRYRAVFTAADAAGSSAPQTLSFTIVRR